MAKLVTASNGAFTGVTGAAELQAGFARLPDTLQQKVQGALDASAEDLLDAYKERAPVAPEFERHPGEMRDSAHIEHPDDRPLSVSVVVDARDENGQPYPSFVEQGHKDARSGVHVPAKPALWPVYREQKPAIQRRMRAAVKGAIDGAGQ